VKIGARVMVMKALGLGSQSEIWTMIGVPTTAEMTQ
jgi:hypothetical protein